VKLISLLHQWDILVYLAEVALRSLAIACIAALLVMRTKRGAVRVRVWTGVLYAALAMPLLGAFSPHLRVGVPAAYIAPIRSRILQIVNIDGTEKTPRGTPIVQDSFSMTVRSRNVKSNGDDEQRTPTAAGAASSGRTSASSGVSTGVRSVVSTYSGMLRGTNWPSLALTIYFSVFAILLARAIIGVFWARRLGRSAEEVSAKGGVDNHSQAALSLLYEEACRARLQKTPELKESAALSVPATLGIRRPVILLPAAWSTWPEERLQAVLAHEISHVSRGDAITQLLSLLHRAFFWFSPLAWWLDRQLIEVAEQASDEATLAAGVDRTHYAEILLGFFAEVESAARRVWWQAVSLANGRGSQRALRRVDHILAWKGPLSMKRSLTIALIAFALPVIFLTASIHPFIAYAQYRPSSSQDAPDKNEHWTGQGQEPSGCNGTSGSIEEPRYVIITGSSEAENMSGDEEDLQKARELRRKINGDFIWFERNEKAYIVRDPEFIKRTEAIAKPQRALFIQQDEFGRRQNELGEEQRALAGESEKAIAKGPDLTPDLERIQARLKELKATGATPSDLEELQGQISELQSQMWHLESQARSALDSRQSALTERLGELSRQEEDWVRREAAIAGQVSCELRRMFDEAIAKGVATPEMTQFFQAAPLSSRR